MGKHKSRKWKQIRLAESREAKRQARCRKLAVRRKLDSEQVSYQPTCVTIKAPKNFALEQPWHDPLVSFLAELRAAFVTGKPSVRIDFRKTERMIAGGALLFFCELQRLVDMYSSVSLRCLPAKDDVVNQVLTHLGVYDLCGLEVDVVPNRADVVGWKTASSEIVDGDKVGKLIEASLDGVLAQQAFRGASEAMINSVNHAYEESRKDGLSDPVSKKWWMFCRQDIEANRLVIAVCDLGIGIPRSLPLKHTKERVQAALNFLSSGRRHTDARLIQAAMEISRTRTGKQGRGLGLHNLKRLIDVAGAGALYIFSNGGMVRYQSNTHVRQNFKNSILGTVVVWSVPLGTADD